MNQTATWSTVKPVASASNDFVVASGNFSALKCFLRIDVADLGKFGRARVCERADAMTFFPSTVSSGSGRRVPSEGAVRIGSTGGVAISSCAQDKMARKRIARMFNRFKRKRHNSLSLLTASSGGTGPKSTATLPASLRPMRSAVSKESEGTRTVDALGCGGSLFQKMV